MQQVLRPYATTGIVLACTGLIAAAPVAAPPVAPVTRAVQLVADPWTDLFTDTTANVQNIISGTDWGDISKVIGELFTNPLGVLGALTNLTPDVTTDLTALPAQVSVELPPGLALMIANLGSQVAVLNALNGVVEQLSANPSNAFTTLLNAPAEVLNAYLNGQDNLSLLGGMITLPAFNGILAPLTSAGVDLDLTKLLDALGLGNLDLSDVDLSKLLDDLGLGDISLGALFSDLGLSDTGLGDLLDGGSGITTLGGVLDLLGLDNLGLGSFSLTGILSGLGLDANVDLNNLGLDQVLTAFGINPDISIGLASLLDNLGLGGFLDDSLGSTLSGLGLLTPVVNALGDVLTNVLSAIPLLGVAVGPVVQALLGALAGGGLENALNSITIGDLLGGQSIHDTISGILTALGVSVPNDLTVGGILEGLGFAGGTGDLTLGQLLGDLGNPLLDLNVTGLLNGLNLGDLLDSLGLSGLNLNVGDLVGDLSGLDLSGLLSDLGLGDLAHVGIDPFGGMLTELFETVPQQILAALGG